MKSMKVLPSALSSASYYLKELASKLNPSERAAFVVKVKENLGSIKLESPASSAPTTPVSVRTVQQAIIADASAQQATPSHSISTTARSVAVANPELRRDVTKEEEEEEDEPISLFESQMIDWMSSDNVDSSRRTTSAKPPKSDLNDHYGSQPSNTPKLPGDLSEVATTVIPTAKLTRSAICSRTRQLVKALTNTSHPTGQIIRIQELTRHLMLYSDAVSLAVAEGAVPILVRLRDTSGDRNVTNFTRQALCLLGFVDAPKGRGIRILSIDGGGMRGVIILEMLRHLENSSGKPIYKLFDLICGVSTGAILTMLIGALRTNIEQCEELYRFTSKNLFKSDYLRGASRLLWTHAYYDSSIWEQILRKTYGEKSLLETTLHEDGPKLMAISASMTSPKMKPYVFRNYNLPEKAYGYYDGSCKHKLWQAVRASSSAPGYFEEYVLDNHVHQDGGIIINNPASIAIHEAKLLWPNEAIQCCVSIGTGRYTPASTSAVEPIAGPTSLRAKIVSFVDSATDTEVVHKLLQDLLPKNSYYRINPTISEWISLDETRQEKIDQLKMDGQMYLRRNEYKMQKAAETLSLERTYLQRTVDSLRYQYLLRK